MKKKTMLALAAMLLMAMEAGAQNAGSFALGARVTPDGGGFSGKFYTSDNMAIELQVNGSSGYYNTNNDGPSAVGVGLVEFNIKLPAPQWLIYLGPGIHAGSWETNTYTLDNYLTRSEGIFGIDAILGVEYIFKPIPLGISADIKPAWNLAPDVAFFPNNFFGVSARYYFNRNMLPPKHARSHNNNM